MISRRIASAFASQAVRALAGAAMLISIGLLDGSRDVREWYILQGAAGWVLLLDLGAAAFISSQLASADQPDTLWLRHCGLRWLKMVISGAVIVSACAAYYLVHHFHINDIIPMLLVLFGAMCALTGTLMQGLVQGEGFVAESLQVNSISQAVTGFGCICIMLMGVTLTRLALVWSIGNLSWVICLKILTLRARISVDSEYPWRASPLKRLALTRGRVWVAFAVGYCTSIAATRLTLLFLAAKLPADGFAALSYTMNGIQALFGVLSFPINGAVVEVLRSCRTEVASRCWARFVRLAIGTGVSGALITIVGHKIGISALQHLVPIVAKIVQSPGLFAVIASGLAIEAIAAWIRPFNQSTGAIAGVATALMGAAVATLAACVTHSITTYAIARLATAIVMLAVDLYQGSRAAAAIECGKRANAASHKRALSQC
jgi:hypothetical protein